MDEQHRPRLLPVCLPTTSAPRDSSGATPFMTGRLLDGPAIVGAFTACAACRLDVDVIRLDHFRGFAAAWHVLAGAPTARSGKWVPAPGADFFPAVQQRIRGSPFVVRTWADHS